MSVQQTTQFPQNVLTNAEQRNLSPQVITGYLVSMLQIKFSDIANHFDPTFRKPEYVWYPDDAVKQTQPKGILITTALKYSPTDANQNPAIIIARDQVQQKEPMSIGSRYQVPQTLLGGKTNTSLAATLGQQQEVNQLVGSHNIYCISSEGSACEILGIEIYHWIVSFQTVIRRDLGLDSFRVGQLGRTKKMKENDSKWITPFNCSYSYTRAIILNQEAPLLKGFTISKNINESGL